jgi:hypothetical protein
VAELAGWSSRARGRRLTDSGLEASLHPPTEPAAADDATQEQVSWPINLTLATFFLAKRISSANLADFSIVLHPTIADLEEFPLRGSRLRILPA